AGAGDRARYGADAPEDGLPGPRGGRTGRADPAQEALALGSDDGSRRCLSQERRGHQLVDHIAARVMFNPKQPGRLWDGELKPRHFVEFTSDSIDKCARVHDVVPSEEVLSGPVLLGSAQNQSKTHAADSQPSRARNAPQFRRLTRSSCEPPRTFAFHRGTFTTTLSVT